MNATKAKISVPPASPSRPSVRLTPLLGADDRERPRRRRTGSAPMIDVADERDADARDVEVALDVDRGDDRHDDLPQELLADADARSRSSRSGSRRRRRGARRRASAAIGEYVEASSAPRSKATHGDDHDDQEAAHRRRALLDDVALRPLLADLLAEADEAQEPDVGRHEDDDEGEGEEQALDEVDDRRPSRRRPSVARPSTSRSRPDPARGLDEDDVARPKPRPEDVERRRRVVGARRRRSRREPGSRRGVGRSARARPDRRRSSRRRARPPPRRPRGGRRSGPSPSSSISPRTATRRPGRRREQRPARPRIERRRRVVAVVEDRDRRRPDQLARCGARPAVGEPARDRRRGRARRPRPDRRRRQRVVDGVPTEGRDRARSAGRPRSARANRIPAAPSDSMSLGADVGAGAEAVGEHAGPRSGRPSARPARRRR